MSRGIQSTLLAILLLGTGVAMAQEGAEETVTQEPAAKEAPADSAVKSDDAAPALQKSTDENADAAKTEEKKGVDATATPAPTEKTQEGVEKAPEEQKSSEEKPKEKAVEPSKEKAGEEETKEDYDEKTPAVVANKLSLGVEMGFGLGRGTDFKSDHVSFGGYATYNIMPLKILKDLSLLGELRYFSFTGVLKTSDYGVVVQSMDFGADAELKFRPNISFQAGAALGITRLVGIRQSTNVIDKKQFGVAIGLQGRALYSFMKKFAGFAGVSTHTGKYGWYSFDLGVQATF